MPAYSLRLACALLCAPLLALPSRAADHSVAPSQGSTAMNAPAYRTYAAEQAEMLVRMTRVLAKDISAGDVDAAANDYPMAHRYLARLAPALAQNRDLAARMDAGAAAYADRERDPAFSGFHRIEHALYAARSTQGLAVVADRLRDDALRLRDEIATRPMAPDALVDGAVAALSASPAGGREPFAQTDLWDIEANLDGAQAVVAAIRPRDALATARVASALDAATTRLAEFKDGCGFKGYDALTATDKARLRETTVALAHALSELKSVQAID